MRAVQVTRGLELELAGSASTWVFSIVNNGFLLIYMCEIFLRFMGRGLSAIRDALTCLDIALVLLTFVERMAAGASMARSLPSIRLLRLLRLIRAFKRMHKSKELVVLLSGTSKAARTLAWVSLFLMVIAWAAGACTRQVIGNSPVWNGSTNPMVNFEPFMSFDNREYFGNIVRSFLSMIQVITNAQWANHIGRPIILQYPALFVFFAFFLLSTTFGLVTCIVANIVQDSLESSRAFEKALKEIDRENRRSSGLRAGKLLMMVDEDGDGQLTQSDLDRALENEEFVQILRLLEVPVMSSENLMRLFDLNGRGHVSFQELVQGITSMLEDIDPKDYTKLALWSDSLMKRMEACEQRCHVLAQQVVDLRRQMEECFNCLALFIGSRENTELYYRALKAIRSAPPPMPVDIREALGLEIKEEKVLEDEAAALMNFARRYVAAGPPTGCRDVTRATVT
ncbi:Cation channel sperm-associated protein 1 [Durusdinium trenchii]|uniref:Cation channel sperm-associated protein 1 n=1 Tax=Durusdinium trenchii TaxID=1381693 RepID=A0ABP0P8D5_9DINO